MRPPAPRELALAACATLVALGLAEAVLRLLDVGPRVGVVYREWFQPAENPVLRYELRPGAPDGAHTISAAGFRGEDRPRTPSPGTFRIAAVGDSVTFGFEVDRQQAWPRVLESLLRASASGDTRFEVLNFGVTGYDVLQVAERARVLALRYRPGLLVYGYVLNDPQDGSFEGSALARIAESDGGRRFRWLAHSRLFLLLRSLAGPRRYAHGPDGEILSRGGGAVVDALPADPAWQALESGGLAYFRTLHERSQDRLRRGFEALAAAAGPVPVLLAIFPVFPDAPEGSAYPLRDVHARVRAEATRVGFHVVDLAPFYAAAGDRFGARRHVGNALHPNPFGYRVAAHAVLAATLSAGLLPEGAVDPSRLRRGRHAPLAELARDALSAEDG